jgi:catechol 2,3-dioxygenase-like lactoylglutathione lyase family enzyme
MRARFSAALLAHPILGLHHVTATVDHTQADLDFYLDALGLRLVKKTVNFDNPNVYHPLWFGLIVSVLSWGRGIGSATGLYFLQPLIYANVPAFLWLGYYGVRIAAEAKRTG